MKTLKIIAFFVIAIYFGVSLLLYLFQTRLIFHPGFLSKDFRFKLRAQDKEVTVTTADGEKINGLFYAGERREVILYFHGNAGDLSGWQFVSEYFSAHQFNFFIIDYRGYGKSTGHITEEGLYQDAAAAYDYLIKEKGFAPEDIIVYGRSIGSGVAVDLACRQPVGGLALESPYASLKKLANEKLPFFFPSLYLKFHFDNQKKIGQVKCPVLIFHGGKDELIPAHHSEVLMKHITVKKELVLIPEGQHNDLNATEQYEDILQNRFADFFATSKHPR